MRRKVAIVTGADAPGIGSHIAIAAALDGWAVVGCGLNEEFGNGVFARLLAEKREVWFVRAGLRKKEDRERLVGVALDRFGRIDSLVNNAGLAMPADRDLHDTDEDLVRQAFENNALVAFN